MKALGISGCRNAESEAAGDRLTDDGRNIVDPEFRACLRAVGKEGVLPAVFRAYGKSKEMVSVGFGQDYSRHFVRGDQTPRNLTILKVVRENRLRLQRTLRGKKARQD